MIFDCYYKKLIAGTSGY